MSGDRCFRLDEQDLEELREQARDRRLVESLAHWIEHFAPRLDNVIAEISTAFSHTRLGDGIGLFQATGLDNYASDEELRHLRARDEKLDWRRISHEDLGRCYSAPSFFDPQGFIFHLPAFLIAELNDRHPYDFISRLIRAEEHPPGWRKLLTEEQRRSLISALALVREHPMYEPVRNEIDSAIQRLHSK